MLNNHQSNSDTIQYFPREKHIKSKVFIALYFILVPYDRRSFFNATLFS